MTWLLLAVLSTDLSTALAQTGSQAQPASPDAETEKDRAAESLVGKGESRTAAREYEAQARANSSDPAPKVRAAMIYEAMSDLVAANTAANEALDLDANNVDALLVLGRIAARQQQWDTAVVRFRRATVVKPDNAAAQLDLGQALEKIGDREGSEVAYATYRTLRGLPPLPLDEKTPGTR
jgi:Flp pilus assembly protein TadD